MMECEISSVEGELYRVKVGEHTSLPIPAVSLARHWRVDFDTREVVEDPLRVGDRVLAHFYGSGYSRGLILGLVAGGRNGE